MRLLLRIEMRRAQWESGDVEKVCNSEFRGKGWTEEAPVYDLRPSMYRLPVNEALVVQCHAEHQVSLDQGPSTKVHLDFQGCAPEIVRSKGETRFKLTQKVHREVILTNAESLVEMVSAAIGSAHRRQHKIEKREIARFVAQRLNANDPVWVDAIGTLPENKRKEWANLIQRTLKEDREQGVF